MPIRSRQNQYRGINAHLHSVLQADSGWDSFHMNHVVDLVHAIDKCLPVGYLANINSSLQVRPEHLVAKWAFSDELFCPSVLIYELHDDDIFGKPVTRLELLLPTTKRSGQENSHYKERRISALSSGLRLVEIDYLHEMPSLTTATPIYPSNKQSFPYSIIMYDPTPSLRDGTCYIYRIAADEMIPTVTFPLTETDSFIVDFGAVYNRTYQKLRAYSFIVDYEQLPVNFERYSVADQERIKRRMAAVRQAHEQGIDLEQGPFPVPDD
jgi:Protein of unknown function (DUF4058)